MDLKLVLIMLSVLALPLQICAADSAFSIADRGQAKVSIVLAENAPIADRTAAKELSFYLNKITGADFRIYSPGNAPAAIPRIWLGQTDQTKRLLGNIDWSSLKFDGIAIKFVGRDLVLAGDKPRGTLYAVYTFLEEYLGCKWWTPDSSYIPSDKNLAVKKTDKSHVPPFLSREAYFKAVKYANAEFAAKLKLNGTHHPVPAELGGHYNLIGFVHTFDMFIPADKYLKTNPEWFSLSKGNRVGGQEIGQLCLTNPEMKAELVKQVLEKIKEDPSAGMISVSQNDNSSYCECEQCTALAEKYGGQSGLLVHFINDIAKEVDKHYPGFLVETLAYHYSRHAPTGIMARDNVIIRLCTAESDFAFPMDSKTNTEFYSDIQAWKKICKNLYVWNYLANFVNLTLGQPNWHVLAENLRLFAQNNVVGMFEQGDGFNSDAGFSNMKLWVVSHLMWDPQQDSRKLMQEFAAGYYGDAAPYLLKFIDLQSDAIRKSGLRLTYVFGSNLEYMQQVQMDAANSLFDQAENAVKSDAVKLQRVRVSRLALDHMWLLQPHLDKSDAGKARGLDIKGVAERFITLSESTGNNYIGEGGLMNESYYQSLREYAALPYVPVEQRAITVPEAVKGLQADQWADIQESQMNLYMPGVLSLIVGDKDASNQRAVRMPGKQLDWATQVHLDRSGYKPGTKVDVYITVKASIKAKSGHAFRVGIYNDLNQQRVLDRDISIEDIGDSEYHDYKLGTYTLEPGWYIYVAPPGDSNLVENIFVDRGYLIKK